MGQDFIQKFKNTKKELIVIFCSVAIAREKKKNKPNKQTKKKERADQSGQLNATLVSVSWFTIEALCLQDH